ncbi:hypothetical protein [Kaistella antarctica]|uniref:Uncharacterized protein n=1 Tax=Kaistella antarctica TaxID=266748 RepID=A0A3S4YJ44_9FLAO|nr:hypothetical protein [Kaistella antarctica]KEY19313.1 hypothetical protein HY04_12975 [Kaistella antarctica]SEW05417.1 hypothetical protein SAMN05421765_2032 [Kaistella antarctica]VEH98470.1 Uncharacterised protein [Kaistella antarctica]
MELNFYMFNMQKLLFIVQELHHRGYEKVRVIPSLSNTGLAWRCSLICTDDDRKESIPASTWIQKVLKIGEESDESIKDLTDVMERDYPKFFKKCLGKNSLYTEWYSQMLKSLEKDELPYAFADYFGPTNYWKTSNNKKIYTLPNEEQYY